MAGDKDKNIFTILIRPTDIIYILIHVRNINIIFEGDYPEE